MLRKGLVALMMGMICAGSATAEESATKRPNPAPTGLVGWLKSKTSGTKSSKPTAKKAVAHKAVSKPLISAPKPLLSASKHSAKKSTAAGIERAVVQDAERQAVSVRQTAGNPQDSAPSAGNSLPAATALQPVPIQQAPVLPNISSVSGPQYFSATQPGMSNPVPVYPSNNWQTYQAPRPVYAVSQGQYWNVSNSNAPAGPMYSGAAPMSLQTGGSYPQMSPQGSGTYPQTGAALYPAPIPGIPQQIGGTMIHNPAFHPHEMLYPHQYKAMYGPYYYKVNGGWMVTPFGVWSHEDWKLQGTTVDVKYKSHISPLTFFHPPIHR